MVVSSQPAERVREVLVVINPDNMLVARRVVVSLAAKKEHKIRKTTRKISAPVEPDSPEVRIGAVRIAS